MTAYQFRKAIEERGKIASSAEIKKGIRTESEADVFIWGYVAQLLDSGNYAAAAIVLWGINIFDPRPKAVKSIIEQVEKSSKCLIMSAGSVGKSYTCMAWLLLDWWRDPEYTNCKVISTTAGHAGANTFSTLVRLHRAAIIKMPGTVSSEYIGIDPKERKSGISVVAIPQGDDGRGRLKGFHPDPRPKPHPTLGPSSRIRVVMDECEEIPIGVWEGVSNVLLTMGDGRAVKVIGIFNPKDQTSTTAHAAEPVDGWECLDVERGVQGKNTWRSRNGWDVLRIDAKYTENVMTGRNVHPGFIDRMGFRSLESKDGGNSIDYWSQGRGIFPPEGSIGAIVSSALLDTSRGEFVFTGATVKVAGVDTAVDGRDNCILSAGRTGFATGFQPKNGKFIKFRDARRSLQVDQQYTLIKGNTKIVGDSIMRTCIQLGISPEGLTLDATGNGAAVFSYLKAVWGDDVQGIDFNASATEIKILEEDQYLPHDLYEGIVSEVWFALAKWMEFGFLAISAGVRRDPLDSELTSRRYVLGAGKKLRVEKKDDYRKRLGAKSPDRADSVTVLLQGVRQRETMMGTMIDEVKDEHVYDLPQHDPTAQVTWMHDSGV